ncbi:PFGI-1 class ICE element type IV pilus protein PilL2 [Thauera mechernichensis]
MQSALPSRWMARSGLLLATTLAAGCASAPPSSPPVAPAQAVESVAPPPDYVPVVRYGRYTLVELAPTAAQQDLLQVVDVAVPHTLHASVGDAVRHVLQRSGYRLCDAHDADALLTLPLPAAHYRLGPVVLHDALLTLAGPAWNLQVDHGTRRVCFTRAPGAQVAVLEGPLADLAEQVELLQRQPAAVTQARYDTEHQSVTQRLADIELALGERLVAGDLRPLQDRLAHLEARQAQRPVSQAAPRPPAAETPRPKPAGPSFQLLGVELRADERFLSIRPYGASALSQVRLLRVGEEEDGWRLETIEDGSATFHRAGERLRIAVPAHQGGSR